MFIGVMFIYAINFALINESGQSMGIACMDNGNSFPETPVQYMRISNCAKNGTNGGIRNRPTCFCLEEFSNG